MNNPLRAFALQFLGVVLAVLMLVVFVAFVSLPLALGRHPGEPQSVEVPATRHMT